MEFVLQNYTNMNLGKTPKMCKKNSPFFNKTMYNKEEEKYVYFDITLIQKNKLR